jgi:hypothetical protein
MVEVKTARLFARINPDDWQIDVIFDAHRRRPMDLHHDRPYQIWAVWPFSLP